MLVQVTTSSWRINLQYKFNLCNELRISMKTLYAVHEEMIGRKTDRQTDRHSRIALHLHTHLHSNGRFLLHCQRKNLQLKRIKRQSIKKTPQRKKRLFENEVKLYMRINA